MNPFRERIKIEGLMPERALLRLRRAGIDLYHLQKPQKNQLFFTVKSKAVEKVFAIYPNVCYNVSVTTPYKAERMGAVGLGKVWAWTKKRLGLLLGGLLAIAIFSYADRYVFGVEFTGADVYKREALIALEEGGIKKFSPYTAENVDLICAKLLSLDGVEYCSVKKSGFKAVVEIRVNAFSEKTPIEGDMLSPRSGTVLSITALKGTALKKVGDQVREGERLVGGFFEKADGTKVTVTPIALARIACLYEGIVEAESEEEAFAKTYLALSLSENERITNKEIVAVENGFQIKILYTAIVTMNT